MAMRQSYNVGEFCWVDLAAANLESAREFYHQILGWNSEMQPATDACPYTMFTKDGMPVAGGGQLSPEMQQQGIPPMWNSYINVEDLDATVTKAKNLGGNVIVPPMQVMTHGRLAFIQDPSGAGVGLWEKGAFAGAVKVNEIGCFCWNELATRDFDHAKKFFADLFGWSYEENKDSPARYDIIKNNDRENGGIMQMTEEWGTIPPYWTVYFTVSDVDASAVQLKQLGGSLHCDPFEIPVGKIAVAADPQGATFNLIQLNEQPD